MNADDYGLSESVNRAIEVAHSTGLVTSTSVMVNQPYAAAAAHLSSRFPDLGVGLHVTLSDGEPLSDPARVRSLVDGDGRFLRRSVLVGAVREGRIEEADVVREAEAQHRRARELGLALDHWDAHQHLQEFGRIGLVLAEALGNSGLRTARCPRRLTIGPWPTLGGMRARLRAVRRRAAVTAITRRAATPDVLLEGPPHHWLPLVEAAAARVSSAELICHPDGPAVEGDPPRDEARVEDLRALCDPALVLSLDERSVRRGTFRDIDRRRLQDD